MHHQKWDGISSSINSTTHRQGTINNQCDVLLQDYTKRHSAHINDTPRGSWASSIFDLKQSQADPILKNLFDRIPSEDVDRNNEMLRQQDRNDTIFSLYPQQDEVNEWLYTLRLHIYYIILYELSSVWIFNQNLFY